MPDISGLNGGVVKATPDGTDLLPIQEVGGLTKPVSIASVATAAAALVPIATPSVAGRMSAADKTKLDGLTSGGAGVGSSPWTTKTANYTALPGDKLRLDATAGDVVITLPVSPTATDTDILFQRLDLGTNKVLLRSGANKFNTQANQDAVFAPPSINLIEGVSYVNSAIGWLNQHNRLAFQAYTATVAAAPAPTPVAPAASGISLTYVSDGDINGLFYYLGTNKGTTAWTSPGTSGSLPIIANATNPNSLGSVNVLVDRIANSWYSNDTANSWVTWDTGISISVSKYTLRNRTQDGTNLLRNWVLEGSSTVSAFDASSINAATWTAIDIRVNDANLVSAGQFFTYTCNASSATKYRYLRLRQNGVNSAGLNYLCLGEVEFYGVV